MVPIFEYDIEEWQPNRGELSIISYEDNRSLIQYFGKWENIKVTLPCQHLAIPRALAGTY